MLTVAAALIAAVASAILCSPDPAGVRLARILPRTGTPSSGRASAAGRAWAAGHPAVRDTDEHGSAESLMSSPRGRALAAAAAGAGAAIFLGGAFGVVAGGAAGLGAWFGLGRLEPASRVRDRERAQAMLPLAADLLIAALNAGCPPSHTVEHVGRALGGPLGQSLTAAAAASRIGTDPVRAWSALTDDPALKPLGRAFVSATVRGISPVSALERAADDGRETARWAAEARARSLGARAAAPLGLCFLPAFVLLGIVPVVVSSGIALP